MKHRCLSRFTLTVALTLPILLTQSADAADQPGPRQPKIRYRMPALMMVAHVEWPEQPVLQDQMAKFVLDSGFNCVEASLDQLDICRRNGLYARVGGDLNEMLRQAPKLKNDPVVFCYFISDRRRRSSFPAFANIARAFEKADPNHPTMFINRANWNEFTDFAKQVSPLMLDFYHYHWDCRRHPERRYIYLAMFRELGQQHGIPVIRCTGSAVSPGQLRQTIYTSLAYGVQGFHFWPPWLFSCNRDENNEPIVTDRRLSARVNIPAVAEVAKEIRPLGSVLIKLRSLGAYHTPPVHPQAPGAAAVPEDFWAQLSGEQLMVGVFEDAEKVNYLLVANCDASGERKTTLTLGRKVGTIERVDKKSGRWVTLPAVHSNEGTSTRLQLLPGGGELLKVK